MVDIKEYDPYIDIIAHEVKFDSLYLTKQQVVSGIQNERKELASLSLLKKDLEDKDKKLTELFDMFQTKPDFGDYNDIDKQTPKLIKLLWMFISKVVSENKLLNVKKLLEDAILIIARDKDN